MGTTVTDLDKELKMKISRIKFLENKKHISFYINDYYKCNRT